ncbi:ribonuclease H-like domain-containing protein [Tanacetum coccineum]
MSAQPQTAQATTLPQAFQTITSQDPSWNMDTGASSHLADNIDYQTQKILLRCDSMRDLYPVTQQPSLQTQVVLLSLSSTTWHSRLGHPGDDVLHRLVFRYKARLVTNERNQQQGIDCDETFSPVVKPATISTVLSLAVSRNWPIHQLDVKNAFLYGHLSETVYMRQPPGFIDPNKPNYVCHLQRSLYGLKQALRPWFQRFASYATLVGFQHSKTNSSLFVFHRGSDIAYLLLYVDDIILTTSSSAFTADHCFLPYILRYVRGTIDHGLQQHVSSTTQLTAYTDADWAGYPVTRRSTSGVEAEYRGVANVVAETAWLRNLLLELHAPLSTATLVYCDNVNVVYLSTNHVQHQRTNTSRLIFILFENMLLSVRDPDQRRVCSLFDNRNPDESSLHKIHTSMSRIGVVEVG